MAQPEKKIINTTTTTTPRIAVIINSCKKFYKKTIPIIIDTAIAANIPSENIFIVVGECDDIDLLYSESYKNHNIIFCKYVNIDYNGAIYFTQTETGKNILKQFTHFFYIHDTCVFMPHFWIKINEYVSTCDVYVKLLNEHSKNIGLFNVNWFLNEKSDLLKEFINYDSNAVLQYKSGNFPNKEQIYSRFKNISKFLNEDALFLFTDDFTPLGEKFLGVINVEYNYIYSQELRCVSHYEVPGITKFQKNWGQSDDWNITL